jgi:hypothetical protein
VCFLTVLMRLTASEPVTPGAGHTPPVSSLPTSRGPEEAAVVRSKRGRSAEEEDVDSGAHKRARTRSRSGSRGSKGDGAEDVRDGPDPGGVVGPPSAGNMDEKGQSTSKPSENHQEDQQMEMSYVDALLGVFVPCLPTVCSL